MTPRQGLAKRASASGSTDRLARIGPPDCRPCHRDRHPSGRGADVAACPDLALACGAREDDPRTRNSPAQVCFRGGAQAASSRCRNHPIRRAHTQTFDGAEGQAGHRPCEGPGATHATGERGDTRRRFRIHPRRQPPDGCQSTSPFCGAASRLCRGDRPGPAHDGSANAGSRRRSAHTAGVARRARSSLRGCRCVANSVDA